MLRRKPIGYHALSLSLSLVSLAFRLSSPRRGMIDRPVGCYRVRCSDEFDYRDKSTG